MKARINVFANLIYLIFGVLFLSTAGCYDTFMTPADDPSPRVVAPKIAILSAPCFREGEALTVYNPYEADLNYFASDAYRVEWLERGVVRYVGPNTPCVCGKTLRVVVTRLEDNVSVGMNYTTIGCKDVPVKE